MTAYKLAQPVKINGESSAVVKDDGAYGLVIPFDPANTDYQAYLKWLEAGNTPEMADNPPQEGGQ